MILLDTSILIDAITGPGECAPTLDRLLNEGEPIALSSLVMFEWLRGPRIPAELVAQEILCPSASALPFGTEEAEIAANLYRSLARARGREIDIGIAATAIRHEARLWTLNPKDFADIPKLTLWRPR